MTKPKEKIREFFSDRTLVLQKVAHSRASREDKLRDILDNFRLLLGRKSGEPLGEALRRVCVSRSSARRWVGDESTYHFALP